MANETQEGLLLTLEKLQTWVESKEPRNIDLTIDGQIVLCEATPLGVVAGYGCQGMVFPVEVKTEGGDINILQFKWFFQQSVDDMGEQFFQDPVEEAMRAYSDLSTLKTLNFETPEFIGLAVDKEGNHFLAMTDLTENDEQYILDSKDVDKNWEVNVEDEHGQPLILKARDLMNRLTNTAGIKLQRLYTDVLCLAHGISMGGFGDNAGVHMYVIDKLLQKGRAYVVDSGHMSYSGKRFKAIPQVREVFDLNFEQMLLSGLKNLLSQNQLDANADDLLNKFREANPEKMKFWQGYFLTVVGLMLNPGQHYIPNVEAEWAGQRFTKYIPYELVQGNYEKFLKVKIQLAKARDYYEELSGESLYATSAKDTLAFQMGNLTKGVDFVFLSYVDSLFCHMMQLYNQAKGSYVARIGSDRFIDIVKELQMSQGSLGRFMPNIVLDANGLPTTKALETYSDPEPKEINIPIRAYDDKHGYKYGGMLSREMVIAVSTEESLDFMHRYNWSLDKPFITDPRKIRSVRLTSHLLPAESETHGAHRINTAVKSIDLDPSKIELKYHIYPFGQPHVSLLYSYSRSVCGDTLLQRMEVPIEEFEAAWPELQKNFKKLTKMG